jgi:hypothetical protein
LFEHHIRVGVHDLASALVGQPNHAREQIETVCIFPLRIVVGKVDPEIAFGQSAQNRIRQRVRQSVCIRMTFTTAIGFDVNTAQDQGTSRDQAMRVLSNANSEHKSLSVVSGQWSVDL